MNNAQFRKLLETPRVERPVSSNVPSSTPALGSRMRSSIPMTPRSLSTGNNEFARQLAAHRAAQQPTKKFRSSAAPKGTKLGEGYTDRAAALREAENSIEDERVQRLEALEQLAKEGHIDREEYVKQTKLLGGDVKSTHLVKGLDFALLKRVRRGENVMDEDTEKNREHTDEILDEKLEKALEKEVVAVERKKEKKQGKMAPPPQTRAEILAELKRSRQAAKEAAHPKLGDKFRKIGEPKEKERIEETPDGVKVKLIVGADGKVKRKVKRSDKELKVKVDESPLPETRVMGMMPPPPLKGSNTQEKEEEDDDIFAGAGDYDLLATLGEDDDEDEDAEPTKRQKQKTPESRESEPKVNTNEPTTTSKASISPPRPAINYFNEPTTESDSEAYKPPVSTSDLLASNPELAAALSKASKLTPARTKEDDDREKRRKALIEAHERDSYDIDMGFGGSTNFGDDDDDDVVGSKGASKKRKRGGGPKKKGDKNSADVVGKIVEEKYGKGK